MKKILLCFLVVLFSQLALADSDLFIERFKDSDINGIACYIIKSNGDDLDIECSPISRIYYPEKSKLANIPFKSFKIDNVISIQRFTDDYTGIIIYVLKYKTTEGIKSKTASISTHARIGSGR